MFAAMILAAVNRYPPVCGECFAWSGPIVTAQAGRESKERRKRHV